MQAGTLRHRVAIQETLSLAQNSYGEPVTTWGTVATVWASVSPLSGRELAMAQQVRPDVTHKVVMRHRDNVTPKQRILHDSRALEIESVRNADERDRMLELMCKEAV